MQVSSGASCQQRQGEGERRHGLFTSLHVKEEDEKKTHHGSCGSSFVLWRASRSICPQQQRPSLSAPGLRKRLTTTLLEMGMDARNGRGWLNVCLSVRHGKENHHVPECYIITPISAWTRNTMRNCTTRLGLTCRSKIECDGSPNQQARQPMPWGSRVRHFGCQEGRRSGRVASLCRASARQCAHHHTARDRTREGGRKTRKAHTTAEEHPWWAKEAWTSTTSKQKSFVAADACRWLGVHHGPGTADWWCLVKT
jgi:hypothetical protein